MRLKTKSVEQHKPRLISAHLYRIPLPVRETLVFPNGDSFPICPRCDSTIDREYMGFCDRCGQRLGWELLHFAKIIPAPRNKSLSE